MLDAASQYEFSAIRGGAHRGGFLISAKSKTTKSAQSNHLERDYNSALGMDGKKCITQ
jgi:hypothetical protein